MKNSSFIYQFITNPRRVGAIWPSSNFLGNKMVEGINFQDAKYIVEFGPGTGAFTEKILERRRSNTTIVLIESNKEFYQLLKEKYNGKENLIIINGSAEHVQHYLKDYRIPYVDYIISGLPFASLPPHVSKKILSNTLRVLKSGGEFVTFQYSKVKLPLLKAYFPSIKVKREYKNIPPAYIINCKL